LDGLIFEHDKIRVFVTSTYLYYRFRANHTTFPTSLVKLARDQQIFSAGFDWDAGFAPFAEVPLKRHGDAESAYAFVGEWTQDSGLILPSTLGLFVARKGRIYMVSAPLEPAMGQIKTCENRWRRYDEVAEESARAAREAGRINVYEHANKLWDKGYSVYRACWKDQARHSPDFEHVKDQAQRMVDLVLKN
jgi:hypothetical protein